MDLNADIIIWARNLEIGYLKGGKQKSVLKNINLQINKGELICLLGPNGSGKSTLIKTLAGLIPALSGSVMMNNVNINEVSMEILAQKRSIVLTENIKAEHLTVEGLVAMGRIPYSGWLGGEKEVDKNIIQRTLELFGLLDLRNRDFNNLSDGEKQKVLIARAFAQQSPIILLDEPTAFLDIPNKMEIMELLVRLCKKENKTVFISTHDLELACHASHRLFLLSKEGKYYYGCPEDLILEGYFDEVFGNDNIRFDINSMRFIHAKNESKYISLEGDSSYFVITEKALNRLGYMINDSASIKIKVTKEERKPYWTLIENNFSEKFNSIGKMFNYLNAKS